MHSHYFHPTRLFQYMKNLLSFLSTFLLFFYFNSFSQSFSYRKVDYTWPKEKPEAISLENQYAKQDAVILDEKCMYNISGNQTPPYNFLVLAGRGFYIDESSDSKNPIVQKHLLHMTESLYRIRSGILFAVQGVNSNVSDILQHGLSNRTEQYRRPLSTKLQKLKCNHETVVMKHCTVGFSMFKTWNPVTNWNWNMLTKAHLQFIHPDMFFSMEKCQSKIINSQCGIEALTILS